MEDSRPHRDGVTQQVHTLHQRLRNAEALSDGGQPVRCAPRMPVSGKLADIGLEDCGRGAHQSVVPSSCLGRSLDVQGPSDQAPPGTAGTCAVDEHTAAIGKPGHEMRCMRHHAPTPAPPHQFHRPTGNSDHLRITVQQHHLGPHRPEPVMHMAPRCSHPPPTRRDAPPLEDGELLNRDALLQWILPGRLKPWSLMLLACTIHIPGIHQRRIYPTGTEAGQGSSSRRQHRLLLRGQRDHRNEGLP